MAKVCPACKDSPIAGTIWIKQFIDDGMGTETECPTCRGTGEDPASSRDGTVDLMDALKRAWENRYGKRE